MENEDIFYVTIAVIFILMIVSSTFLSSIILFVLICNWRTKCRSILNLLTINSCVAFIFLMFAYSIQTPYLFLNNEQQMNTPFTLFCRIRAFLFLFACVVKVTTYLTQAISRFFLTVLHQYRTLQTYHTNAIMIVIGWLFSAILSACMFISPISFQYEPESRLCFLTSKVFHTSFTLMMIAFVIPVAIIIFLYAIILRHTRRTDRVQPSNNPIRNNKRDVKVFQNILRLLAVVIVGGTPFLLSILINRLSDTPWPFYLISILCIGLATSVEVFAVFFMSKEVKAIVYTKFGFVQRAKVQTLPFRLMPTALTHSIRNKHQLNVDKNITVLNVS